MVLLSPQQQIEFAENLSADEIERDEIKLPKEGEPHWLIGGVRAQHYCAVRVTLDGRDIAAIYYHVTDQRELSINGIISHTREDVTRAIAAACEVLCRNLKAQAILAETRRSGMIKRLVDFGYQPIGVVLKKEIA